MIDVSFGGIYNDKWFICLLFYDDLFVYCLMTIYSFIEIDNWLYGVI